jgi:hypothetical protein
MCFLARAALGQGVVGAKAQEEQCREYVRKQMLTGWQPAARLCSRMCSEQDTKPHVRHISISPMTPSPWPDGDAAEALRRPPSSALQHPSAVSLVEVLEPRERGAGDGCCGAHEEHTPRPGGVWVKDISHQSRVKDPQVTAITAEQALTCSVAHSRRCHELWQQKDVRACSGGGGGRRQPLHAWRHRAVERLPPDCWMSRQKLRFSHAGVWQAEVLCNSKRRYRLKARKLMGGGGWGGRVAALSRIAYRIACRRIAGRRRR